MTDRDIGNVAGSEERVDGDISNNYYVATTA
jgi:hypothetical protein